MATTLAALFAGWDLHQQRIVQMIAPLTPEQLLLRSAPDMWHVSILAAHVIGTRAFWFHEIMREGPPEMAGWSGLDDIDESARTVERLVQGLDETWAMIGAVLARCTADDLDATFERVYPTHTRLFTRQSLLLRVLTHDAHHGGEISQILGMHGVMGMDW
ncbi:MAG: DinB family protein [Chloroflexi bacterium]|nr:MAG: DinB family protein [Chloroflexota bacterium]